MLRNVISGWIHWGKSGQIAGAFRTDKPLDGRAIEAVLIVNGRSDEHSSLQPITKTVWQWRYKSSSGSWLLTRKLWTEEEVAETFISCEVQKHAGPFEVPI